eukprot:4658548-Amphidinium_carterae.1
MLLDLRHVCHRHQQHPDRRCLGSATVHHWQGLNFKWVGSATWVFRWGQSCNTVCVLALL